MHTVRLSPADVWLAERQATACALGGNSQIRESEDRAQQLIADQLVGQLGTIALHRYWFGDLTRYVTGRYYQNLNPWQGDRGEDIPGCNIDVKTSRMRRSQNPLDYNLPVRPKERHDDWVYVLALIPTDFDETRQVHLVGWCHDAQLPKEPNSEGPLAGAFVLPASYLHPLPPVRYNLLPNL